MNIYDYGVIENFNKYNKIIEKFKFIDHNHDFSSKCKNILDKFPKEIGFGYMEMCFKAISYLDYINRSGEGISTEPVCKYLYFWIYHYFKKNSHTMHSKNFYKEVLNEDSYSIIFRTCFNYSETIPENELENMKYIYDMKNKINDIKTSTFTSCSGNKCLCAQEYADIYLNSMKVCGINYNSDFCNEIKNIRNEFLELELPNNCPVHIPEIIYSLHRTKIQVPIIVTFLVIFVICMIIFIVCKFTPYSSWFHGAIKIVKNKLKNIHEEKNIVQNYERYNIDLGYRRYSVLYYSS
ncbi:variable surface protein [Plasmodium gonderi]|uniref:Variable surface protein n=1 Tax=Plasmodium gonderi TaxID=77519 RepID=A0A1Y1JSA7_PLAGO|nr:variable surface protein [Plasmodium gonderi]GAW84067.1 variable surface protein [Plasmodium gonderi]